MNDGEMAAAPCGAGSESISWRMKSGAAACGMALAKSVAAAWRQYV